MPRVTVYRCDRCGEERESNNLPPLWVEVKIRSSRPINELRVQPPSRSESDYEDSEESEEEIDLFPYTLIWCGGCKDRALKPPAIQEGLPKRKVRVGD